VKRLAALVLALAAADEGRAATAYVTDELVLGVYQQQSTAGERLATLHSGASVETLAVNGDATQVRLADGVTGWVKSAYLTTSEPAIVRLKQLQDELDRSRAATPMLAEAAERSEVARLRRELAEQSQAGSAPLSVAAAATVTPPPAARMPWWWTVSLLLALAAGFCLGYATLARRVKIKFGGIKVY
jgi:hypothetical protein